MSVFKKTGVYHFRFMHRGRVIRKSTKQGDKRTAELMEAKEKTALALGDAGLREKPKAPTLAQFITNRLTAWVENQKSTTGIWFKSGMRPLAEYKPIAGCTLDAITSEKIADYAAHRQGEGLAVGSINRELRVLRRCLRLATEWGIVETAPKVKMAGAEIRRERVVGDEEFRKYLACAIPLLTHVATLLNETGLRPEECHRLEWSDIDLGARALLIRQGKTPAARRRLPLTPNARNVLESRWQDAGGPETGFVFPAPTMSGHIEHWTLKKQHRKALAKSGVRNFLLYSLRHTFATKIAPRVDAWTLCRIMGWASLSVAMTYVHAQDDRVLAAFSGQEAKGGHEFGHTADKRLGVASGEELQAAEGLEGYMVSAAGFEPATHALKGHCSTS